MDTAMIAWKQAATSPGTPVVDVLRLFERNSESIALVVDERNRLLGTVTDGDVRRAILKGVPLSAPVTDVMGRQPITLPEEGSREQAVMLMNRHAIRYLPVLSAEGRVVGLLTLHDMTTPLHHDNWVVLMAGGEGRRLRPLTESCPKPMIRIGGRPILELILQSFIAQGFHRFFIAVNYMGEVIEEHFGDGARWGAEIRYLREESKLGTAGALSLLPERPHAPFCVMNGDLLTRIDYASLFEFHRLSGCAATLGVREHSIDVPFGVVSLQNDRVLDIVEKPTYTHFINAGIYVLNPDCLDHLPSGQPADMPALLSRVLRSRQPVGSFPIHEYWMDIGRLSDLERAHQDYEQIFL